MESFPNGRVGKCEKGEVKCPLFVNVISKTNMKIRKSNYKSQKSKIAFIYLYKFSNVQGMDIWFSGYNNLVQTFTLNQIQAYRTMDMRDEDKTRVCTCSCLRSFEVRRFIMFSTITTTQYGCSLQQCTFRSTPLLHILQTMDTFIE